MFCDAFFLGVYIQQMCSCISCVCGCAYCYICISCRRSFWIGGFFSFSAARYFISARRSRIFIRILYMHVYALVLTFRQCFHSDLLWFSILSSTWSYVCNHFKYLKYVDWFSYLPAIRSEPNNFLINFPFFLLNTTNNNNKKNLKKYRRANSLHLLNKIDFSCTQVSLFIEPTLINCVICGFTATNNHTFFIQHSQHLY